MTDKEQLADLKQEVLAILMTMQLNPYAELSHIHDRLKKLYAAAGYRTERIMIRRTPEGRYVYTEID